jgi:protein-disulfide isomerase
MKILMRCMGVIALIIGFCSCATDARVGADSRQMRAAVRQVLEQDPEIILELLRQHRIELYEMVRDGLAAKQEEAEAAQIAAQLRDPLDPDLGEDRPFLGPQSAPVVIVAYSDFLCHYCGEAARTLARLISDHPQMIRFYHKHHPLSDAARDAALYFEALARQQPQFAWQFYDLAFALQSDIAAQAKETLDEAARSLGADMARLRVDLSDPVLADRIQADTSEAQRFGFDGTPAVVINGVGLSGARSLQQYEQIIALTAGQPQP